MGSLSLSCCQAQHFRLLLSLPLAWFPHWGRQSAPKLTSPQGLLKNTLLRTENLPWFIGVVLPPRPWAQATVGGLRPVENIGELVYLLALDFKPFPSEILSFWETSLSGSHFRQNSNPQHSTQITNSLQSPSVGLQELPFGREFRKYSVNIWRSKGLARGLRADGGSHGPWAWPPSTFSLLFFSQLTFGHQGTESPDLS